MNAEDCASMEFLLQADIDGQLGIGETAALAAHLAHCPACRERQAALRLLSKRLRTELPYHTAPAQLRQAIEALARPTPRLRPAQRFSSAQAWLARLWPLGAGAAFATVIMLALLPAREPDFAQSIVASHIRALQPGHLMDVESTDRHTVKPWFDGRLDYAPPVKDLAAEGFPLVGGRLDYLAGRPVAALDYGRAKHVIDLYVWPAANQPTARRGVGTLNGYNYISWSQDQMVFWAVSDLNATELAEFVAAWRAK